MKKRFGAFEKIINLFGKYFVYLVQVQMKNMTHEKLLDAVIFKIDEADVRKGPIELLDYAILNVLAWFATIALDFY